MRAAATFDPGITDVAALIKAVESAGTVLSGVQGKAGAQRIGARDEVERKGDIIMEQATDIEAGLFAELRKLSPKVTGGLLRMRQEAYRDGTVAAKYKLLTAMAISIAIRVVVTLYPGPIVKMACDRAWCQPGRTDRISRSRDDDARLSWGGMGAKGLRRL